MTEVILQGFADVVNLWGADVISGIGDFLGNMVMGAYRRGYSYGYGYGYLSYLVFMLPALILGLWAQLKVKTTFSKYNQISNSAGMTGEQAARMILDKNGLSYVRIEQVSGSLTDHFDPRDNVIRLSSPVYGSTSIGAVGVAAHEAGHAVQHAEEYAPIKLRSAIIPVCNFGSSAGPILIMVGCLFAGSQIGRSLIFFGILLFSLMAVFQLVTLPVEFDASARALNVIRDSGIFEQSDYQGAKKVLSAAALTYVAALVTTLLQILYYVVRFLGGSRRND
ncbi:MAG: zinc metallopeptidase [Bacteroidales bacterium]|nr:zinc metallopeptidase [Clostridium sp.]MCM1204039.1 zinc metallopeptidase [Bacteroidales bacterium]